MIIIPINIPLYFINPLAINNIIFFVSQDKMTSFIIETCRDENGAEMDETE
jgi:hypothetical protein